MKTNMQLLFQNRGQKNNQDKMGRKVGGKPQEQGGCPENGKTGGWKFGASLPVMVVKSLTED